MTYIFVLLYFIFYKNLSNSKCTKLIFLLLWILLKYIIIFFVVACTPIIMLSILSNPYFKIETGFNKFVITNIYYKLKNILPYRLQLNPNPLEP